jgi:hypothetical protein
MARNITREIFKRIKARTADLIDSCHGIDRASECTRVSPSMLSNYQRPQEHHIIPTDIGIDLMLESGDYRLLHVIAETVDHVAIPLKVQGEGTVHVHVSRLAKEVAEVFEAHAEALNDGGMIYADEADRIAKECDDVMRKVVELAKQLRTDPAYRTERTSSGVRLVGE